MRDQNWNKTTTIDTKTVISSKEGRELLVSGNHMDQNCNLLKKSYKQIWERIIELDSISNTK